MTFNNERIKNLIEVNHNGNYKLFAKEVGVDYTTMFRVLKGSKNPGRVFIGKFVSYCRVNALDFNDYIFLESTLP